MRPGFYFCLCPDWELTKDHIEQLIEKHKFCGKKKVFWADEGIDEEFWSFFLQRSLFKESFVLIIRKIEVLRKDFWEKIDKLINRFYPKLWPFFCLESSWVKGEPQVPSELKSKRCWKFAEEKNWIWKSPGITPGNVVSYFVSVAKKEGIFILPSDLFQIKDLLPQDGAGIKNEVKKLKLLLKAEGKNKASLKDILNLFSSGSFDIFSFISSLEEGKDRIWAEVIGKKNEDLIFLLVSLLFKEMRVFWQIKVGDLSGINLPEIVLEKKRKIAKKLTFEDISKGMDLLLDVEFGLKNGLLTPSSAIDFIVCEFQSIFSDERQKALSRS